MRRIPSIAACLVTLLVLLPAESNAVVGVLRTSPHIWTHSIGQITPDAGLECVGTTPTNFTNVYSLATGIALAPLVASNNTFVRSYHLEDFDGDGFDDVLAVGNEAVGQSITFVSLQRYSGGSMVEVFPEVALFERNVQFVGTMRLNAGNPNAMVFQGPKYVYIVRQTGVVRYRADTDGSWPASGNYTFSVFIDDFRGNGFDQVLVTAEAVDHTQAWNILIGDSSPALAAEEGPLTTQVRLMPSTPNPAYGPARIAFELPTTARVQMQIFDAQGRLVNRLVNGQLSAGRHEQVWDGRGLSGERVNAGAYFYELVVDGVRETRKMIQLR
ncbi:MAG: FlgD immunoglobulin-like domain containing protein [Candidatus Eisenbacteria bacterium]